VADAPLSATALAPAPEKSPSVIGSERAPSAQSVRSVHTAEALAENIPPSSAAGTAGKGGTGLLISSLTRSGLCGTLVEFWNDEILSMVV